MEILTKIREMPDNKKKIISLVVAIVLTFFVVGLWYSLTSDSVDNVAIEEKVNRLSSISPWQMIKDEFSRAFSGFDNKSDEISTTTVPVEIIEVTNTATSTNI